MDNNLTYGTRDLAPAGTFAMPGMVARPRVAPVPTAVRGWQPGDSAHLVGDRVAQITGTRVLGTLPFGVRPIGTRLFGTRSVENAVPAPDRSTRSAPEPLIV